jgi:hypothetical protein
MIPGFPREPGESREGAILNFELKVITRAFMSTSQPAAAFKWVKGKSPGPAPEIFLEQIWIIPATVLKLKGNGHRMRALASSPGVAALNCEEGRKL